MNKHRYLVTLIAIDMSFIETRQVDAVGLRKIPALFGREIKGKKVAEFRVRKLRTAP